MILSILSPEEWTAVQLSLKVAIWATLFSLPVATAVSYVLARHVFWGKQVLNAVVHLPLILPPVVTGYLLLLGFGPQGPIGQILQSLGLSVAFRWSGAALAAAVMGFPLLVRAMRLSFEAVDSQLEEAARTLGAPAPWVFITVTLPLAIPGIITGMILCFAKAMGEFGATITFVANIPGETQTLPSAIYALLQAPGQEIAAARLVLLSIFISITALLVSEYLAKRVAARIGGKDAQNS